MEPHELIKTPCSENWNCMSGDEQRRYCDKCQHYVHDLTGLTLEDISLLRSNHKGRFCGMFRLGATTAIGASLLSLAACTKSHNDSMLLGECLPPDIEAPSETSDLGRAETKTVKTAEEKPTAESEQEVGKDNELPIDHSMILGMICPPSDHPSHEE